MKINISIHGLKIENQKLAERIMLERLKIATKEILTGENKDLFGFRDMFESDIEVEVEEHAGMNKYFSNIRQKRE
jgi:hypothetical protein